MVIEELYTKLGFQVDPQGIEKGKSLLSGFKTWIGGLALGAGFVTLAKTGLDAAMTMESLNAQFTVMTGSAERAAAVIGDISDFAAKTPFSKMGLADAGKTLMAFGMQAQEIVPTLKMLGDVAGADQNRLNSLALAFGQIQSAGTLRGQDLLQLINQGFNPLTIISQKTGIAMADLKDAMSQGAISADMVTAAFKAATSEGGLFYGNLEAQSQTLAGRISTLKDNFVTALQNMAEAFLPLLKAGADALIAFDWSPIVEVVQGVAGAVGTLVDIVATLMTWLKRLSPLLMFIFGPRLIAMISTAVSSTRMYAASMAFVEQAHLAAAGAAGIQGKAIAVLKTTMHSAATAAKSFGASMKSAMVAALTPLNILLVGLTAIKELYDYFITQAAEDLKRDFDEMDFEQFQKGELIQGSGPEGSMSMREMLYTGAKKKYEDLLYNKGKVDKAELDAAAEEFKRTKAQYEEGLAMYKRARGVEWTTYKAKTGANSGAVKTPGMSGDAAVFQKMFADLKKSIDKGSEATKKQTKATEDNTRAQKAFDISALSRQAFDAAFNVKLRELTLGTI